jgi:lysophospholipase L1-like esterase
MKQLLPFLILLLISSCAKKEWTPFTDAPTPVPILPPAATWLALGDSYTIGQSVPASQRFPSQAVALLKGAGIQIDAPTYIAATGWTTFDLEDAINRQKPVNHTVVSLLIGVNDQYQWGDTTGYRQRFTGLLQTAIRLANGKKDKVVVLSIPDYSVTPFARGFDTALIRIQLDQLNTINKEVTDSFQCPYFNITPLTREARTNSALLAGDGLHPSGLEYQRWAEQLANLLAPVLKK